MYGVLLFFHLVGLSVWAGGYLAILIMMALLRKQLAVPDYATLARRVIRSFGNVSHLASLVVLATGIPMIVQMGLGTDKPLWLQIMEKGGGMIILLALVFTGLLGRKAVRRLAGPTQGAPVRMTGFLVSVGGFLALIFSVVLAVSLRV